MNARTSRLLRQVASLERVVSGQSVSVRRLKRTWRRLNARNRRVMRVAARREITALSVELLTGAKRERAERDRRETDAERLAREEIVRQVQRRAGIGAKLLTTLAVLGAAVGLGKPKAVRP